MPFKLIPYKKQLDITGFYTAFCAKYEQNYYFAGERHNFWELVYVLDGKASAVAEKTGYILSQGDIIFHKPMEFHTLASDKKNAFSVLIVSFDTPSSAINFFSGKIFTLNQKQRQLIDEFINEVQNGFDKESNFAAYQLGISYIERLLVDLIRENSASVHNERNSDSAKRNIERALISSIKSYIHENIYGNLTLSDICNKFNMSRSYICHLFKKEVGKSVMDYYFYNKIEKAKELIESDLYNISEISEKLGYTSIHNFSRSFKSKAGMSPSAYKKIRTP